MSSVYIRFVARGTAPLQRSPLIERLIARASRSAQVVDWRADAFGLAAPAGTPMPPVAVAASRGAAMGAVGPDVGAGMAVGAWVCVATPVRLSAGMTQVTFPVDGMLQLDASDAAALAVDFNRVFAGAGVRLAVGSGGTLVCEFDAVLEVATHDPEVAVGRDVFDFQPAGRDAPRLRRLSSEIEMWLFDHEVNRRRTGRGLPAMTGLWFWGGGVAGAERPTRPVWAAGRDAFFAAFGDAAELPRGAGAGVVVADDSPGSGTWPDVERVWLLPALAELRAGHLGQIHISAARRRFTMARGANLRFWRRTRPWWEAFDLGDDIEGGESR